METVKNILLVGAGGFVGSILRYVVAILIGHTSSVGIFPWATLVVNVVGALMIGVAMSLISGYSNLWLFAVAGVCGGFTTFSAFSLEVVNLLRSGDILPGVIYVAVSLLLCLSMTVLGIYLGRGLN